MSIGSERTDVVVIGSGFAGISAAIEAKKMGASVIVLEKLKARGGNSMISDGCIAAAGTPFQKEAGIEDSPDLMYADMLKAGLGLNHPELARLVAERSAEIVRWVVEDFGVKFNKTPAMFGGHSAPRSHNPPNLSGTAVLRPMLAASEKLGIEIRTRSFLERLVTDENGTVTGVEIREGYRFNNPESGMPKTIRANRAVVLAAGGYGADRAFRAVQDPRLTENVDTTNHRGATSEVLVEAMRIGAMPVQLSWIQLGPWACPDEKMYGVGPGFSSYVAFPYGLVVDPETGRRFMNELADRKIRADAVFRTGHPCIAVADSEGLAFSGQNLDLCLKRGVVRRFDSVEQLAEAYGIPEEALLETIERFNRGVAEKEDKEFGKPILNGAKPLVHPPYYAMRLWPKVHYTMGGIRIDTEARVIDLYQKPIPRLYAAGEITGGVHGACRLGSAAIPDCMVFGRIAGQNAAKEIPVP